LPQPKKILFISYDGLTDPLGQSQIIPYLTGLTEYGYQFTILSCDKPHLYKKNKAYISNLLKPFSIQWVSVSYHKQPLVFSSIFDFYRMKKKARQLHKKQKFDIVHTRPGIPALIGLSMKKKWGVKFLNDIREFYADSRLEGGMWNKKFFIYRVLYNFFKKKEDEAIDVNDGIVCLTYAAEKIIKALPQYKQTPLQVIPCSTDLNLFDPIKIDTISKENLAKELGIEKDDFIISYLGSIGGWYLTDEMMKFCKIVSDKIPRAKFLFISPQGHDIITSLAKKYDLPSGKIITRFGQRYELPVLLSFSMYSIFFIKSCYSKISSSPTKHGELMAMGIPVITNAGVGDVEEIVNEYNSGIVLKELNKNEFYRVADLIHRGITFNREDIRKGAKHFYALEKAVQKYSQLYKIILT
jgi:glycosyltransferase involved in cell wall biosynthesis